MNQKLLAEILKENLTESSNGTTTADIATFGPLNMELISKIYPDTLVSQIANIQPSKSPVCKIAAIYSNYTGSASNNAENVHYTNSLVIAVSGAGSMTYGASAAVSGVPYVVVYAEQIPGNIAEPGWPLATPQSTLYNVLIKIREDWTQTMYETAGGSALNVFTPGSTTFLGQTVLGVSKNRTAIKKMFFNFGQYTTGQGELLPPKVVSFETKTVDLPAKSRKVVSKMTYEKLQDLKALYNGTAMAAIIETLSNQISQEIDYEVINYLKDIASPYQDKIVNLPISAGASLGMANELAAVTDDLYLAIFVMIEDIVRRIKRNRTMFILCDSFTAAFLQLNPLHIKATAESNNPVRVGSIGPYPLYVDYYSTDNYMLVGYAYDGKTVGDAGLLYAPYVHEMIEVEDSQDMFKKNILTMNRYAYTRHPQDSGNSIGDSDFFKICTVDFRNIKNLYPFNLAS
jgi:hypothetical protein